MCHLKSFSNSFELTVTRGSESSMPLESLEVIAYPGQAMVAMCCNLRGASNCSPPNCSLHGSCEFASQMRLVILECDNQSGRSHNGRNSAKCRLENDTRSCRNIYHSDLMAPHLRLVMEHPRRAEFQKQRERSVKLVKKVLWKKNALGAMGSRHEGIVDGRLASWMSWTAHLTPN